MDGYRQLEGNLCYKTDKTILFLYFGYDELAKGVSTVNLVELSGLLILSLSPFLGFSNCQPS